jgi:hypothetical protein
MLTKKGTVAAVAAAVAALAVTTAASAGTYNDGTGDGKGAPDIGKVTVASDGTGQILFTIGVDNLPSPSDVRTLLLIDSDMNQQTGKTESLGADYAFLVDESDNGYAFGHWNGTAWEDTSYATVGVRTSSTGITISVNRSELGNTSEFNFWVRTLKGDSSLDQMDDGPDDGTWNYSLAANGPDIQNVLVQPQPALPMHGQLFSLAPAGLKLPPTGEAISILPQPESYTCTATLKGQRLAGVGTGGCTWKLPKTSKGKTLVVTLTVSYQGATKSFPFTFRVG